MSEDPRLDQIDSGVKLIKSILKDIKHPADENSKKEITESVKLLEKKYKLLNKDEQLAVQYMDRTAFDTVQGCFQALHLYIISTDEDKKIEETVAWLRSHENCYSIANRMQKAALQRADFNGGKAFGGKK